MENDIAVQFRNEQETRQAYSFYSSLVAGAAAGLVVDLSMFPLDTLKTRLQSQAGFWKSGGFKNIYKGIGPAATGSMPSAAIFFSTYDSMKHYLESRVQPELFPFVHIFSASAGEVAACSVRVPVEILKQRLQANQSSQSALNLALNVWKSEGIRGCYRGLGSTILREVPFSCIQFPIWEYLKMKWKQKSGAITPFEGAICGAIAGGLSAFITTPLDVAKTRIMLFKADSFHPLTTHVPSVLQILCAVYKTQGISGLFAGMVPRVAWLTAGGIIFFGVYEHTISFINR